MQIARTRGEKIFDFANCSFMLILCAVMVYPIWQLVSVSFSDPVMVLSRDAFFRPAGFSTAAYKSVLTSAYIWSGFANTLFVTVMGTLLSVFFTALTAFSLSKRTLPGKTLLTFLVVFTMLFGGGLIPHYFVVRETGLLNSLWSLMIPVLISPFHVIVMRNFFSNIPGELEEAAKMDGANDYWIFFTLIIPLSLPVIATVTLWTAVSQWNDFFHCLLYVTDKKKYVLQMILREMINATKANDLVTLEGSQGGVVPETIKAAGIMVATFPILMVYPFMQKYFVKGLFIGSLKG